MGSGGDYSDEYVVKLLKQDAEKSKRYSSSGLPDIPPRR